MRVDDDAVSQRRMLTERMPRWTDCTGYRRVGAAGYSKERKVLYDLLNIRDWFYYYEVVVRRQGREQILARLRSRPRAELAISHTHRRLEVSRPTISYRRMRGIHPHKAAELCGLFLIMNLMLPWFWPWIVGSIIWLSLIGGLLSSGKQWQAGGDDDR